MSTRNNNQNDKGRHHFHVSEHGLFYATRGQQPDEVIIKYVSGLSAHELQPNKHLIVVYADTTIICKKQDVYGNE